MGRRLHRRQCCRSRPSGCDRKAADVVRVVSLFSDHDCPQNPGILGRQGDNRFLPPYAIPKFLRPGEDRVVVVACQDNGLGTLSQQGAQISAAPLGDTAQIRLAATGMLLGCQAQPGTELSAVLELLEVIDASHHSRCGEGTSPLRLVSSIDLLVVYLVGSSRLVAPVNLYPEFAPVLLDCLQH